MALNWREKALWSPYPHASAISTIGVSPRARSSQAVSTRILVMNWPAVIWKMLLVAEQRFRGLDAPERMKQVFLGDQFQDGVEVKREEVLAVA